MLCKKVLPLLSEFFDGVLDTDTSIKVSQHLDQCISCRKEFKALSAMHAKLNSLNRVPAPEYLRHLVQHRVVEMQKSTWRSRLQDELELRWSRIKTTEGMWYATRAMGTVMATVFFFLISSIISPYYIEADSAAARRDLRGDPAFSQKVGESVLVNLGMLPPKKRMPSTKPAINDEYLYNFADRNAHLKDNDQFSVVMAVDQSGAPKIQRILEYPENHSLLNDFNDMIASAKCRPASKDGESIPSHMALMFSKIVVSD